MAWYHAAEVGRELVVEDTLTAERHARSLSKGRAERRDRIPSLSIKTEADRDATERRQQAAALLEVCPRLEILELVNNGSVLGAGGCQLGKRLTSALAPFVDESFEVKSSGVPHIEAHELFRYALARSRRPGLELTFLTPSFLSKWSHLRNLVSPPPSSFARPSFALLRRRPPRSTPSISTYPATEPVLLLSLY